MSNTYACKGSRASPHFGNGKAVLEKLQSSDQVKLEARRSSLAPLSQMLNPWGPVTSEVRRSAVQLLPSLNSGSRER